MLASNRTYNRMYINNLSGKPIKDISFAGLSFSIPAGISACWDKFGQFLFKDIYKIEGADGGVPAVVLATAAQWKGDRYVEVVRFPMNHELIPSRRDLIRIAKQRGVDKVTLEQWDEDQTIENSEIVKAINELAVPDEVKYPTPEESKVDSVAADLEQAADDVVADKLVVAETPKATVAKPVRVPAVGAKPKSEKVAGKTAAKKAPATPKAPKAPAK